MDFSVIITAGGTSSRYGNKNKLLETINGKTIIEYTVEQFLDFEEIIVCANESIIPEIKKFLPDKIKIIKGGETRQASVYNGLQECTGDYVLIHDGARPLISKDVIKKTMEEVKNKNALTVAVKTVDTIKKADKTGKIISTIDRSDLYNIQTPQAFKTTLIKEAHEKLKGKSFTDDAGMLEHLGFDVYVIEGEYKNIKLTTTYDLNYIKTFIED
ncbi:2-C-methyl-D-erythritol 4-phosphate cytidylyltransferase [bacterium]|nr:2-C-methyl-D-erythritol 4-phosphate cytidylyltransferase [bacterium]